MARIGSGPPVLNAQLTDQYAHHFHLIVSILKGVVLYSAATSILAIHGSSASGVVKTLATMYWVAGLAAMITNYDGIMVGSLIITRPPNMIDVVMPFLLGVAEFAHFAVLVPLPDNPVTGPVSQSAQLTHLLWWPMVFAVFTLIACIEITATRRSLEGECAGMPPQFAQLIRWYRGSLVGGQRFTGLVSVLLIAAFFFLRQASESTRQWQGILAVLVFMGTCAGLVSSEQARRRIVATLTPGRGDEGLLAAPADGG